MAETDTTQDTMTAVQEVAEALAGTQGDIALEDTTETEDITDAGDRQDHQLA